MLPITANTPETDNSKSGQNGGDVDGIRKRYRAPDVVVIGVMGCTRGKPFTFSVETGTSIAPS